MDIPKNAPKNSNYKYVYIFERGYDKLLKMIYDVGIYAAHRQFYAIYKRLNPLLSDSYIRKKCTQIIKELKELGFIEVNNINNNKYLYLKKPSVALFTGDYLKTPRVNHSQDLKNDKFLISLMKLEYFISNNIIINNSNLVQSLYWLTKKLHVVKMKYSTLEYNLKDIDYILNEKDYSKIKEYLKNFQTDNILKIVWIDIYNVFRKLLLQNQTINLKPTYFKLFRVDNTLRIHYVPNIFIWDLHDNKYYERKINNLFYDFTEIPTNNTYEINENYRETGTLGLTQYNHIGYSLTLVGYNKESLENKIRHINKFIEGNPHTPIIKNADYIYIDIAKYIDHASQYNSALVNADNYIDTHINQIINFK